LVTLAAVFAAAFNVHHGSAALVLFTLIGPPAVCVLVTIDLRLTRATPDRLLGRVMGVYGTAEAAATLLGMGLGGVIGQTAGIGTAANIAWVVVAGAGVAAGLLTMGTRRRSDAEIELVAKPDATGFGLW
jgi:hypothetical protein